MESTFGKAAGAFALVAAIGIAALPAGAQQQSAPAPKPATELGANAAAAVPDATVQRAGAAIRDLSGIQARYTQRMQNAQPAQRAAIEEEANGAAQAALAANGLSVEEYNGVIRLAQADQGLRERLISAARGAR